MKLDEQYSIVLKENVVLRKNDEEYDKQKIDKILKDFEFRVKNKAGKDKAMKKIEYKKNQKTIK